MIVLKPSSASGCAKYGDDADDAEHHQQPAAEEAGQARRAGRRRAPRPATAGRGSDSLHRLRRFGPAWCQITPAPSATSAASQPISVLGPGGPPIDEVHAAPTPSAERDERHQLAHVAPPAVRVDGQHRPEHRVQDRAEPVGERQREERDAKRHHRRAEMPGQPGRDATQHPVRRVAQQARSAGLRWRVGTVML